MTKQLPDEIEYGFVADRIIRAVGDTTKDPDRYPDGIPSKGTITFTPVSEIQYVMGSPPTRVEIAPIVCTIYQGDDPGSSTFDPKRTGLIVDPAGRIGNVALVVGHYVVSTQLEGRRKELKRFAIHVTPEHTSTNPLWLAQYVE